MWVPTGSCKCSCCVTGWFSCLTSLVLVLGWKELDLSLWATSKFTARSKLYIRGSKSKGRCMSHLVTGWAWVLPDHGLEGLYPSHRTFLKYAVRARFASLFPRTLTGISPGLSAYRPRLRGAIAKSQSHFKVCFPFVVTNGHVFWWPPSLAVSSLTVSRGAVASHGAISGSLVV